MGLEPPATPARRLEPATLASQRGGHAARLRSRRLPGTHLDSSGGPPVHVRLSADPPEAIEPPAPQTTTALPAAVTVRTLTGIGHACASRPAAPSATIQDGEGAACRLAESAYVRALHARAGRTLPADAGVARVRRSVVVKLGSSTLVDARGRPRRALLSALAGEIASLAAAGVPVCVVSSGAIALGAATLDGGRPADVPGLQAASAVGQGLLVAAWQRALASAGLRAGQVLLTASDMHARTSYLNARATLETLLALGRRAGRQRERLDRHGRDHVRRQRRARRPGRRAAARAPARAADGPGRPVHAEPQRARRRARARGAGPPAARRRSTSMRRRPPAWAREACARRSSRPRWRRQAAWRV